MKEVLLVSLAFILVPALLVLVWGSLYRRRHPPSTEALEAAAVMGERRWLSSGWAAFAFAAVFLSAGLARKLIWLHGALDVALVILPVLAFLWFLRLIVREVRQGDELARQVHHDALFSAFVGFMTWAVGMWFTGQFLSLLGPRTFDASIAFLALMYWVGVFVAKARYIPLRKDRR